MITGLLGEMLLIFGTFLILTLTFAGVGLILRRAFGLKELNVDDCFLAFWTGFGIIILILMLWNFFLPVGLPALLLVLSLGLVGIVWNRRDLISLYDDRSWRLNKLSRLFLILVVFWIANQSMAGFKSYDGALYHLQGVRWAKTHPVVPGIANLHGPLAFNNSSFLYDAMLDSGWWEGGAFHVANGVLVFVLALQAIVAGSRFAGSDGMVSSGQLYSCLLLAPALYLVPLNGGVTSYSTDLPLTLLFLVATAKMYDLLSANAAQSATTEDAYGLFSLSILLATAVCIKSTAAVFAAVAMPIAAWLWWKRRLPGESGSTRTIIWTSVAIVVFAVSWVGRGIVMSGYPFFPLTVAGFPVDWRAPAEHAEAEFAYLAFTEREFSWEMIGRDWLRMVLWYDAYAVSIPAAIAATAFIGFCVRLALQGGVRERIRHTWWLLLPVLVSIVAWFLSAPSTRYSPALFWTLAALCLCELQRVGWSRLATRGKRWAIMGLISLGISPLFVEPVRAAIERGRSPMNALLKHNWIMPNPDRWFDPGPLPVEVTTFNTGSGLTLNVPMKRPRPVSLPNSCWDAPIPCTPNPAPNLRLRETGRLDKGFKLEGEWQMLDWPYHWDPKFLPEWRKRRGAASSPS